MDNGFIALIDYEPLYKAVTSKHQQYTDWTVHELDDELASNFSGKIKFNEMDLLYVQSGDGDGSYNCYGLSENNQTVGIECDFEEV